MEVFEKGAFFMTIVISFISPMGNEETRDYWLLKFSQTIVRRR